MSTNIVFSQGGRFYYLAGADPFRGGWLTTDPNDTKAGWYPFTFYKIKEGERRKATDADAELVERWQQQYEVMTKGGSK